MADTPQNMQPESVIASIFGVSNRRIQQLKAEGIIKSVGRPTKYDLLPTIKAYIKYLADKAYGREQKQTDKELGTEKLKAESRYKQARAEMAELELKELRGQLHRAEDVEAITTDHVMFLRSMLMALPGSLAVDLAAMDNPTEVADRIQHEVNNILARAADYRYDPAEYQRRVRERQGWNERRYDDEPLDSIEDK